MLLDCKEKFLIRSSCFGNRKATHELYKLYADSVAKFDNAAHLYREVITKYNPKDAIEILLLNKKIEDMTRAQIEKEFIHSFYIVADYMALTGALRNAAIWAKKGIELFDFFHSRYPEQIASKLKESSRDYQKLNAIFEGNKKYFDSDLYYGKAGWTGLKFDWEKDYTPSIHHDNDNLN